MARLPPLSERKKENLLGGDRWAVRLTDHLQKHTGPVAAPPGEAPCAPPKLNPLGRYQGRKFFARFQRYYRQHLSRCCSVHSYIKSYLKS